jgi:prepilin-type N-terminal cleavage/methylation domain-containing protein
MGLMIKNKVNNGFTLIELIVVIGTLSILSTITLSYFNGLNRRGREVAAQNALLNIKKECENNYMYSLPLFYEDIRLQKYSIISNGQNSCYGDSITGLVSAVPEEKDLSPYYYYNFNDGELSCSYQNGEKLSISECNSNNLDKSSDNAYQNVDENNDPTERYKCADIGDWNLAQTLLSQGHSYLDRDKDGEACEVLAD